MTDAEKTGTGGGLVPLRPSASALEQRLTAEGGLGRVSRRGWGIGSREDAKTRRSQGVIALRHVGMTPVQGECFTLPCSCPTNANGVETPSPGLAEERGLPWV